MEINDFVVALNNGEGFEFLCNHGHEMDKNDLIRISKELLYAIEGGYLFDVESSHLIEEVSQALEH